MTDTAPRISPSHTREGAMHFAITAADLLSHLAARPAGDAVRRGLSDAAERLAMTTVFITRTPEAVRANGIALPPRPAAIWRRYLYAADVNEVEFTEHTSERELLLFLVLLSAPGQARAFGVTWLEHGSWRIHVSVHGNQWDTSEESIAPSSTLRNLGELCEAVARGELHARGSTVLGGLQAHGADASAHILRVLAETANGCRRRFLYEAIVALGDGEEHLRGALQHDDWRVVRNAAALLGELRVTGAVDIVSSLLLHEEWRVRVAAATSLGQLASREAHLALIRASGDPHADVRAAAWGALACGDVAPPGPLLDGALRREEDAHVQHALLSCAAAFPELEVGGGLIRFCARALSRRSPRALVAFGVEQLAIRRPESAKSFIKHLPERFATVA